MRDIHEQIFNHMTKYSQGAQAKIKKVMHEYKEGELKSGKSSKKVKSRKQAVAIGISEAKKVSTKTPLSPKKKSHPASRNK